jgi:hypothetical protein
MILAMPPSMALKNPLPMTRIVFRRFEVSEQLEVLLKKVMAFFLLFY